MFSPCVIIATEMLLNMEWSPEPENAGPGFDIRKLELGPQYRPFLRKVCRKLQEHAYIYQAKLPWHFVLLKNPEEITVLQVIRVFHGDVCLGEPYNHRLTLGGERYGSSSGRQFREFESEMKERCLRYLSVPITQFRETPAVLSDSAE